jgi:hypothetical protein
VRLRQVSIAILVAGQALAESPRAQEPPSIDLFVQAASADDRMARSAMDRLAAQWRDSYRPMIIDMVRQLRMAAPSTWQRRRHWLANQSGRPR